MTQLMHLQCMPAVAAQCHRGTETDVINLTSICASLIEQPPIVMAAAIASSRSMTPAQPRSSCHSLRVGRFAAESAANDQRMSARDRRGASYRRRSRPCCQKFPAPFLSAWPGVARVRGVRPGRSIESPVNCAPGRRYDCPTAQTQNACARALARSLACSLSFFSSLSFSWKSNKHTRRRARTRAN